MSVGSPLLVAVKVLPWSSLRTMPPRAQTPLTAVQVADQAGRLCRLEPAIQIRPGTEGSVAMA